MIKVEAVIKPVQGVLKTVAAYQAKIDKAEQTAVRVEGFRLMRLLRAEIRRGAPGGQRFAPLSIIRRTMNARRKGRLRSNNPLAAMARAIGYEVDKTHSAALKIGFVGPASSTTWRRLALEHQSGFYKMASEPAPYGRGSIRRMLLKQGLRDDQALFGKSKAQRRNVFFLRRTTERLKTPARPIIDPFWRAHRAEAAGNILENILRKLRGERI